MVHNANNPIGRVSTFSNQSIISIQNSSESNMAEEFSFNKKFRSVIRWLISPFRQCCSRKTVIQNKGLRKFDVGCLKPQYNQVNGLLKYFTFGVMFTNGILGFVVFIIGLWSSFENRQINQISTVNSKEPTPTNIFSLIAILLCIFGLLFFLICIISCMGIYRENLNLLRISLIGQFLTMIVFLTFSIVLLVWNNNFLTKITDQVAQTMYVGLQSHYHIDESWKTFFDKLQLTYYCCEAVFILTKLQTKRGDLCVGLEVSLIGIFLGVFTFNDWNDNPNYACTTANVVESPDACAVPYTCCKRKENKVTKEQLLSYTCGAHVLPLNNGTISMDDVQEHINTNGCFDEILPVIQQLASTAAIFMLLISVIVFITIFLTGLLVYKIRATIFEVKRHCGKRNRTKPSSAASRERDGF